MPIIPFANVAHLTHVSKRSVQACLKKRWRTYSIALGRVIDASFSSSDMCAPASGPMKHQMGDDKPTKHDNPVLDQLPPLLDVISDGYSNLLRLSDLLELREDVFCWGMVRHNPQSQQKCKESKDVEKQHDTLRQRKVLREVNIEPHSQQNEQEDCHCRLP